MIIMYYCNLCTHTGQHKISFDSQNSSNKINDFDIIQFTDIGSHTIS